MFLGILFFSGCKGWVERNYLIVSFLVWVLVYLILGVKGDLLFVGMWYCFSFPAFLFLLAAFFKPVSPFCSGVSVGTCITFLFYFYRAWNSGPADGLLGLGHVFSVPGILVGILMAGILQRHLKGALQRFSVSLFMVLIGFFFAQIALCNSVLWCGPFTFLAV
ncbi:hypothetical protein D9M71_256500 [compost metagenome]